MGVHQHAGHLRSVDTLFFKRFDDNVAGFPLILAVDLFISHQTGAGNGAVKVVCVRGSGRRNGLAGLRPDGRMTRMGMHNTANGREGLVEQAMRWRVGGGFFFPSTTSPVAMLTTTISSAVITV